MRKKGQIEAGVVLALVIAGFFLIMGLIVLESMRDSIDATSTTHNQEIINETRVGILLDNTPTSGTMNASYMNNSWIEFDGDGDYVDLGSPIIPQTNWTISTWVNCTNAGKGLRATLLDQYIVTNNGRTVFWIINGTNIPSLAVDGVENQFDDAINLGRWQHLAVSLNDTNASFYLNGVFSGSAIITNYTDDGRNTGVGKNVATLESYALNGTMDEVRIYNATLSTAEIVEINGSGRYQNSTLTSLNLIGWWKFQEYSGTTLYSSDNYTQTFNATLVNGSLQNDGGLIELTENTDYNITVNRFEILDRNLKYNWVNTTYSHGISTGAREYANDTLVGLSSFSDFWDIIILAVVTSIVFGIIIISIGKKLR